MEPGNLMGRKLRARILYATLVAILAVLITLATSFWAPYSMYESGFPFSWETRFCVAILVESPGGFGCSPLTYNWLAFALDMLFYALVGYGLLLGYGRYHVGKPVGFPPKQNSEVAKIGFQEVAAGCCIVPLTLLHRLFLGSHYPC
jgi:hypothetical protein